MYSDSSLFEFKIHCNLYPYWLPVKISGVTAWLLLHILCFLARYMVAQIQIAFYTPSYILGWSCIRLLSGGIEMIWYHCPLVEGVELSPGPLPSCQISNSPCSRPLFKMAQHSRLDIHLLIWRVKQRRSPSKMVGGAKLCLDSNRIPEKHLLLLYWLCQSLWLCGPQQTLENS